MVDIDNLVAVYQSEIITVPVLAARFGIKPADAAAILRIKGVKIRRGSPTNNLTPAARAKGNEVRQVKALRKTMKTLVDKHGMAAVGAAFDKEAGI